MGFPAAGWQQVDTNSTAPKCCCGVVWWLFLYRRLPQKFKLSG